MLQNDMNKAYQTALNLERTVIDDAEKKAESIIFKAHEEEKEAISAATENAKHDAEQYEQRQRAEILAKYSNMVTEYTANCRTQLLKKRTEIQEAVFGRLRERIVEFTASDEYAEFLKSTLVSLKDKELSDKSGRLEIIASKNPADKTTALEIFPDAEITISDGTRLGGFIVKDIENGVMYVLTLDSSLELKKSDFPSISGLKISD